MPIALLLPDSIDRTRDQKELTFIGMLCNKRHHKNYDAFRFYEMSSTRLKFVLGNEYRTIALKLVEEGIIECDESYEVGHKSKGYRLADPHQPMSRLYIEGKLAERIAADRAKHDQPVGQHVINMKRMLGKFVLNMDEAKEAIDFTKKSGMTEEEEEEFLKEQFDKDEDYFYHGNDEYDVRVGNEAQDRLESHLDQAYLFQTEDRYLKGCPFGRYHTPITSLWSKCRNVLRIEGRLTCNIDIANSQAHLVCDTMLRLARCEKGFVDKLATILGRVATKGQNKLKVYAAGKGDTHAHVYRQYAELVTELAIYCRENIKELTAIAQTAREGNFFESLMKLTNYAGTRGQFKAAFWKVFFGQCSHLNEKETEAFEAMGALGGALVIMKRIHYAAVPKLFQALEAEIMYESKLTTTLINANVTFTTVHDSIICLPEHADIAINALRAAFKEKGFNVPTVNCSDFSKGNVTSGVKTTTNCYERTYGIHIYRTTDGEWNHTTEPDTHCTPREQWSHASPSADATHERKARLLYVDGFSVRAGRWPERSDEQRKLALMAVDSASQWQWSATG